MSANNYYGIPVHGQPASYTPTATGYPGAPPPPPPQAAAVGYTTVGHATAAAASNAQRIQSYAAAAASPAAAAAAAYSAYPQTASSYAAAAAASATPIVAAAAQAANSAAAAAAYSYPQYAAAQQLTSAAAAQAQQAAAVAAAAAVPAAAYYPQPSIASVTYSAVDNSLYQARPIYSQTHAQLGAAVAARPTIAATAAAAGVAATTRPASSYLPTGTYTNAYTYAASTPTTTYSSYQPTSAAAAAAAAAQLQSSVSAAAAAAAAKSNIYVQPQVAATANSLNLATVQVAPAAAKVPVTWRAMKPVVPTGVGAAGAATMVGSSVSSTSAGINLASLPSSSSLGVSVAGSAGVGIGHSGSGSRPYRTGAPRIPPKPQQLHYCEVCKISCAGPQTYKEHLEGQKHKKKEAGMKTGTPAPVTRLGNALRCELCDVTCTGSDAYAAHIRGAKHQKVVKLHTKLGKPIPCEDPVLVTKSGAADNGSSNSNGNGSAASSSTVSGGGGNSNSGGSTGGLTTASQQQSVSSGYGSGLSGSGSSLRGVSVPKITFVGADRIKEGSSGGGKAAAKIGAADQKEVTIPRLPEEKDVQPVGHDYIEEIKGEDDKIVSFSCKLCECKFNDPNAKDMHMKGRRHRLQYKKKVNPDLVVDIKPSLRQRKMQEERAKRSQAREEFWKRRDEEFRLMEEEERHFWSERRRFEDESSPVDEIATNWYRRFPGGNGGGGGSSGPMQPPGRGGPPMPPQYGGGGVNVGGAGGRFPLMPMGGMMGGPVMGSAAAGPPFVGPPGAGAGAPPFMMRRPDSLDDRHCLAKHEMIYPRELELEAIQKVIAHTETALKKVSDILSAQDVGSMDTKPKIKPEPSDVKPNIIGSSKPGAGLKGVNIANGDSGANKGTGSGTDKTAAGGSRVNNDAGSGKNRILIGLMRVGLLAKQLLLTGDTEVQLVVVTRDKPTKGLLDRIASHLPAQLAAVATSDVASYEVKRVYEKACLVVTQNKLKGMMRPLSVTIFVTSPKVRESSSQDNGESNAASSDLLNRERCIEALAELRHVKWFASRVLPRHPSIVVIIRILRDLCKRNPTWSPLKSWTIELLVERVLRSVSMPLPPGDALRRVFEALAGGILLPDSPGFLDPCEKEPTDAAAHLTNQEREDITSSSQYALRLIAFRQVHKVLGMEPLPMPKTWRLSRKRRRDSRDGADEGLDEKRDKRDE